MKLEGCGLPHPFWVRRLSPQRYFTCNEEGFKRLEGWTSGYQICLVPMWWLTTLVISPPGNDALLMSVGTVYKIVINKSQGLGLMHCSW